MPSKPLVPETYIPTPRIPFIVGTSRHTLLSPGQSSETPLSAGRWVLSPKSLLPFVTVNIAKYGGREFTWGQTIEIPEDSQGTVVNTSFHTGDAVFDAVGTGAGNASLPPAGMAIPAIFALEATNTSYLSQTIDVRAARRVYLCMGFQGYNSAAPLPIQVVHQGSRRATYLIAGGQAASTGGLLADFITVAGYKKMIPLGYGSDEAREVGGANTLPEYRPMCLFDALFVSVARLVFEAQFQLLGSPVADPYFYVEY